MEYLGTQFGFKAYYLELTEKFEEEIPNDNWFIFGISNTKYDDSKKSLFYKFIKTSIDKGLLAFHGQGKYGEHLHASVDEIIIDLICNNGYDKDKYFIMTAGNNETNLGEAYWEAFYAAGLPDRADYDNIKLVCVSFDGKNYKSDLKKWIKKYKGGWLPSDD